MSTSPPANPGKSLFESRTVWSILAAAFFAYLPTLLTSLGVTADQQGAVISALHQLGTPLALVAGILFHAISTKPVTSILPQRIPPTPPAAVSVLVFFAAVGLFMPLGGCKTAPLLPPTPEAAFLAGDTTLDATYNTAARLYLGALPNMSPAVHDKLKPALVRAYALVQAVDGGQVLAGETSLTQEIADATQLTGLVKAALQP